MTVRTHSTKPTIETVTDPQNIAVNGIASQVPADASGLNVSVELVSPELAAHWLARGGKNRKVSQRRVGLYAAAMHRGEWRLTGDAIKLDADGTVRDGQNRLHAVVESGVSIQTVVVRGVDEGAFDVMDTGKARTTADVLAIHGYASSTALAGAARLLMFMERFGRLDPAVRDAQHIITGPTILAYIQAHPDVANGQRLADAIRQVGLQGGTSTWTALMTLFLRIDAEKGYQFAHYLKTGEDMTAGHPVLILRNRLLWEKNTRWRKSLHDREEIAALIIKAWNAFRADRTIHMLAWKNDGPKAESFPVPS